MRKALKSPKSVVTTIIMFLVLCGSGHMVFAEEILRMGDKKLLSIEGKPQRLKEELRFKNYVSEKNLLELKRESPFSLPRFAGASPKTTKTLKLLAIRVEFQEEVPDDPLTTGKGLFDMRTQDEFYQQEGHLIDPSPHGVSFFEAHIRALHNYWFTVSEGTIALEGEVFPRSDTTSYPLPHPMVHYGAPDSSLSGKVEMLRQFFHDSFNLADSFSVHGEPDIYGIDFSQYDCFMIFHAGSDIQSDLGPLVNYTPGDLFTGFIVLGDTVWVNDGIFPITEGIFMPETKTQDNRVSALNAEFAHEFGHQLGLPDLYNSETFTTQVGDFALMDNNAQNVGVDVGYGVFVSGVLPVYPCAWSRAFLGLVEPVEITNQEDIGLFAATMLSDQLQVIRIPITTEEYFLIENRQRDIDDDHVSALRADSATNVILGPVDDFRNYNREYDWLLPGAGILIWHTDEEVAYFDFDGDGLNNFWDNDLQVFKDRRFLTLVEADGIIDFGGDYYTGFGQQEDMFYWGNNTEFTPYTFPPSKSRNGSDSRIWVTDISINDTLMTLDIFRDWFQPGFPRKFIPESDANSLVFDKDNSWIFASSGRFIHAWDSAGSGLLPYPDSVEIMNYDSTLTTLPLAIFAEDDSDFVGSPSLGDLNGDDTMEVVAVTTDGRVFAWHPFDREVDGRADVASGFPVDLQDQISVVPIIADFDSVASTLEIFVATRGNTADPKTIVISHDGSIIYSSSSEGLVKALAATGDYHTHFLLRQAVTFAEICLWNMYDGLSTSCTPYSYATSPIVAGDIDRDGDMDVVCRSSSPHPGLIASDLKYLLLGGSGFFVSMKETPVSGPILGDIDLDGYPEIVVASAEKIFAFNFNGSLVSDFPVTVSHPGGPSDLIASTPIIGDVDADGYPDIIVGTKNRQILSYNKDGKMVAGFPLPVGGSVTQSPILMDLDKDSDPELAVASDDGFIYAWDLPGTFEEEDFPWVMEGYDAGHTNYFPKESLPPVPPAEGDLLPANMAFNYPNPANGQTVIRYYLKEDAEVDIRIYDLSGMLVDQFPGPGIGLTHNERLWDCSKFASGVYLCRVEAQAEKDNQVVFLKMAVVK
jgi:M6 family metalloprotease-like protein